MMAWQPLLFYNNNNNKNNINNNNNTILKYKNLIIKIQRTWNVKAKLIPVIRGANGTVSESLRQYRNNIPGKHETNKNGFEKDFIVCPRTHEPTM